MDRKLNLAKIAYQNTKKLASPLRTAERKKNATESPYFSPLQTRNQRKVQNRKVKSVHELGKSGAIFQELTESPLSQSVKASLSYNASIVPDKATTSQAKSPKKRASNEIKNDAVKKVATKAKKASVDEESKAVDVKKQRKHIKIEFDDKSSVKLENEQSTATNAGSSDAAKTTVKQSKKRASNDTNVGTTASIKTEIDDNAGTSSKQTKFEPKNWEQMLRNIREMRKDRSAPVDTMGCHKCSDEDSDEKTQRFHHLIALMLSSQTKDNVTYDAMNRLREHGLTPAKMVETNDGELEKLLYPVSFYKNKAKYIKKTAQILIDKFDSDIPNDIKGLVSLPGVGPKMAHICMRAAWNIVTGIGVDTHVHRISNRLKWLPKETKEPEQTRVGLEEWLPFEYWAEVNELLVGFGQTICTPTNPKCGQCLNYDICPSKIVKKKK